MSHLGLPTALLVLHLASIWVTLFAMWMLACRCWPERSARAGVVMLLACWLSLPVAGTALVLMDPYLTARSFSTPCMVLALLGMLDATGIGAGRRERLLGFSLWLVSLGVAAAMHPLMTAYACAATLLLACVRAGNRSVRGWGTAMLAVAGIATAALISTVANPETAAYRHIALTRTYWFPALWNWYELLGLAAPLAILAIFAAKRYSPVARLKVPDAITSLCIAGTVTGATAWLVAACFARSGASSYSLARLQPLRIFQIVYFLMVLMLGATAGSVYLRRRMWRWVGALLLLGGIMFAADRRDFPNSPHLELPGGVASNPWVEAFLWIRNNTPQDALFALDSDYINESGEDAQCFRAIAQRSALPDYSKDGGEASIAPDLAGAWTAGQRAQQKLNDRTTSDAMRVAALEPFGVSWVVLNQATSTRLDCPYANSAVKVCQLH